MTKGELLKALDDVPDSANVVLVIWGRDIPLTGVDASYEGFVEPRYVVRMSFVPNEGEPG